MIHFSKTKQGIVVKGDHGKTIATITASGENSMQILSHCFEGQPADGPFTKSVTFGHQKVADHHSEPLPAITIKFKRGV